jgi:hypothetical protein
MLASFLRQVGVTGGTTLCFGAPIAALALSAPFVAAIPLVAGLFILLSTGRESRSQSIEIAALGQIAERIAELLEG